MVRTGLKRKSTGFAHCILLIFMCTVLLSEVRAEEEKLPFCAKVYCEMSDSSNVTANLIEGNTFEVLETVYDDEGGMWYRIRTDFGVEGYVRANEIDRLKIEKQEQPQELPESAESLETGDIDENTSAENVSDEEILQEEASDAQKSDKVNGEVITLAVVNLRSMPSAGSKIINKIGKGVRIKYSQKLMNDTGESWYKVDYDGMEGYVIARAVRLVKEQQSEEEKTVSDTDNENNSETEELSEAVWRKNSDVKEKLQPEPQSADTIPFAFEVDEESTVQNRSRQIKVDWMLVMLTAGGILCIAAIVIFTTKIRKLLRK